MNSFEKFISENNTTPLIVGTFDCASLAEVYLDCFYPHHNFIKIRDQVHSLKDSLKFNAKYKWKEELNKAFKMDAGSYLNFDLLVCPSERGCEGVIVNYKNYLYSVSNKTGLISVPTFLNFIFKGEKYRILDLI